MIQWLIHNQKTMTLNFFFVSLLLLHQAILRKVQDAAMMLRRDADMKKRILEVKQKYD